MLDVPRSYDGVAFNPVPGSENRIHSDDVARQHGFRGGLVPGVVISAYLVEPAVRAWGLDFLARGRAAIAVRKPLYDGDRFEVRIRESFERGYEGALVAPDGVTCADARVELPATSLAPPVRRGDPPVPEAGSRPPATREALERLRERGMGSIRARFERDVPLAAYHRDVRAMPELVRAEPGGYANAGLVLGLTNWVLAANVCLGPWLHLQADAQNHAPVPLGSEVVVEAAVADLFERKGHAFVDLDVAAFLLEGPPVVRARLRAIYRLRGDEAPQ